MLLLLKLLTEMYIMIKLTFIFEQSHFSLSIRINQH